MSTPFEQLGSAKTVLLTTYKRDGTPVATPVSIAFDGDRAFFRSWHKAHKATRLRNNPAVEVAPSTFRGMPTGPAVGADARLLEGPDTRVAARALARRHRLLQATIVPIVHRLMRYRTLHYELTAHEEGSCYGPAAQRRDRPHPASGAADPRRTHQPSTNARSSCSASAMRRSRRYLSAALREMEYRSRVRSPDRLSSKDEHTSSVGALP